MCSSTDIEVYRHDFSWGDVCNFIGIENVSSPVNHLLCSKHYQQVYRMLNVVSKACVCCEVKRRHKHSTTSSVQFVTCPNPKRVESYLKSTIDFSYTVQDGDQVCYPCYKFFNEDVVLALKAKKVQIETNEFQNVTSESYVELYLYTTALSTCELLVNGRAFLFSNVYRQLMEYLSSK